jgi:hypothetical protein
MDGSTIGHTFLAASALAGARRPPGLHADIRRLRLRQNKNAVKHFPNAAAEFT